MPVLFNPILYSDQVAMAKKPNSIPNRIMPGVTTGAAPERLGSLGTAKVPQTAARTKGNPMASTYCNQPSLYSHPQAPTDTSADISSKNRTNKGRSRRHRLQGAQRRVR